MTLSAYCIDKTEVTVAAYAACVADKRCIAAPLTVNGNILSAKDVEIYSRLCNQNDRPNHPINCVDWDLCVAGQAITDGGGMGVCRARQR